MQFLHSGFVAFPSDQEQETRKEESEPHGRGTTEPQAAPTQTQRTRRNREDFATIRTASAVEMPSFLTESLGMKLFEFIKMMQVELEAFLHRNLIHINVRT